ncbi:MAG: T9SS type A sorting domain-containing protein [Bacteroidota bacterium]
MAYCREINTSGFVIEKSTNGLAFDAIGTVAAKGKSSNNYDFMAAPTNSPVNYYRLKMTDRDGRFTYSNSLRINNNATEDAALSVFPNPAKDQISVSGLSGKGQIRILDTRGKLFNLINTNAQTLTIDISKYAVGLYILQYITEQETISQKLMKQ